MVVSVDKQILQDVLHVIVHMVLVVHYVKRKKKWQVEVKDFEMMLSKDW
jgi:hypothetical protein